MGPVAILGALLAMWVVPKISKSTEKTPHRDYSSGAFFGLWQCGDLVAHPRLVT